MSSEWIKWEGGQCPVEPDLMVDVKCKTITSEIWLEITNSAKSLSWGRGPGVIPIIAYRLHCNCDGCTDGDDEIPEFLKNDFKDDDELTDHELDEPSDGIPEELAIEDIPPVLRPETETMTGKGNGMDDLERLARELHNWDAFVETIKGVTQKEWQAKRNDLSGRPKEWVNEWAQWRAQDANGKWFEFNEKPRGNEFTYKWVNCQADGYRIISQGEVLGDWRGTLEERVVEDKAVQDHELETVSEYLGNKKLYSQEYTTDVYGMNEPKPDAVWTPVRQFKYESMQHYVFTIEGDREVVCQATCVAFRLIKTPKEKAIEEMAQIILEEWSTPMEMAEAVYDAGFKK